MSMDISECRMSGHGYHQCTCGGEVEMEDLGDNPSYLSGVCECGLEWAGNHLAGYEVVGGKSNDK